jgi:hypothetical protein
MMENYVSAPFIVGGLTLMFLPTMIVCNKVLVFDGAWLAVSFWKCWLRQTKKLLTNPDWKTSC